MRVLTASAGSYDCLVSMKVNFGFYLIPELVMLTPSHIPSKELDLLYSVIRTNSDRL